jgi:hypothetical protein
VALSSADGEAGAEVRRADAGDAEDVARLLHDFNTEYDEFTPGVAALAPILADLLERGEATALLGGDGPTGWR